MKEYIHALANAVAKPRRVRQTPIHIQLEHTTYCNMNCKSCERSKFITYPTHLSLDHFTRVVEQIHPKKMTLGGVGEPFMHPRIFDMIRLAKQHGCSMNTTTNGTLLSLERCEQLVKSGLDLIKISIDAATRGTYLKVRGEDKFLQVLDGIRGLLDAKKRLDSEKPYIRLNYVIYKDNYQDMAQFVGLAERLGVDAVYFQPLDLVNIEERQELLVGDLTYEQLSREITWALDVNRRGQLNTNLEALWRKLPTYWEKYRMDTQQEDSRICVLPWFSTYVTVNGTVHPCCSFSQNYGKMGNIIQQDFFDIWNGEAYQRFRRSIRQGKRPYAICKNCVPRTLWDIIRSSGILPGFLK